VANLPSNVTEQSLGTFFARHGPVGSVKIMWPRGDGASGPGGDMTASRRNRNAGLSGFVSFMKRKDAESALREIDGFDWGGSILRVGWSKAVPMAAKPLYGRDHSIFLQNISHVIYSTNQTLQVKIKIARTGT
jgi:U2-associated protein SR140